MIRESVENGVLPMKIHTRTLLACLLASLCTPVAAQQGGSSAGRAVSKRFAALDILPLPELVVVEDIVNYHRHRIPLPKAGRNVAQQS